MYIYVYIYIYIYIYISLRNSKNVKSTHAGVMLLKNTFTKSNIPLWLFFTLLYIFLLLYFTLVL